MSLFCEFLQYIMTVTVSRDPYSPDDTDFHLPKAFRGDTIGATQWVAYSDLWLS